MVSSAYSYIKDQNEHFFPRRRSRRRGILPGKTLRAYASTSLIWETLTLRAHKEEEI
jgi:hypothetical protein